MTRHLLRLIWNRKRQNFLLTLEIFFSFLTLFGVVLFAMQYANNARQPLGYEIDRVWSIDRRSQGDRPRTRPSRRAIARPIGQLLIALREMPQVEGVARGVHRSVRQLELGRRHAAGGRAEHRVRRQQRHRRLLRAVQHAARGRPLVLAARTTPRRGRRSCSTGAWREEIFGDAESDRADHPGGARSERSAARSQRQAAGEARHRRDRRIPPERRARRRRETTCSTACGSMAPDPKARLSRSGCFVRLRPGTPAAFEETLVKRAMAVARRLVVRGAAARRDARATSCVSTPFR